MTEELKQRCKVDVPDGGRSVSFHRCSRVAKGTLENGTPACGVHIAAERKRRDNQRKWDEEQAVSRSARDQGEARCVQLAAFIPDDTAEPHYRHGFGSDMGEYTGGVVLTAEATDALLAILRTTTPDPTPSPMTQHAHATYTPGCYRCELSRDEATESTDNLHTSAPPIEPEAEPLSDQELTNLRVRVYKSPAVGLIWGRAIATIDRLTRERDDWKHNAESQFAAIAEQVRMRDEALAELARLRPVVEAAKAWKAARDGALHWKLMQTERLIAALDALEAPHD